MDEKHRLAEQDYIRGLKYKEIAEKYNVALNTIKSWKKRYAWQRKKGAPDSKGVHTKKRCAYKGDDENKSLSNCTLSEDKKIKEKLQGRKRLTDKQQLFIMEYLRDFNATRAALAVGYRKKTAHTIGWEILRKPEVQAEMKRQKEVTTTELGLSIQRVIGELMKIAFTDMTDLLSFEKGYVQLKPSRTVDGGVIAEIKEGKHGVTIKVHDKLRALKELEKYLDVMTSQQRLQIEMLSLELNRLKKDQDDDAHEQSDSYEEALHAQSVNVFSDEGMNEKA